MNTLLSISIEVEIYGLELAFGSNLVCPWTLSIRTIINNLVQLPVSGQGACS